MKTKQMDLSNLKSTSEKDIAVITEELETIESELKVSVDTRIEAEDEIRRLEKVIENFDEKIIRLEQEK